MHGAPEPISPELVLVSPELRERALARLHAPASPVEDAYTAVEALAEVAAPLSEPATVAPPSRRKGAHAAAIVAVAVAVAGAVAAWRALGGNDAGPAGGSPAPTALREVVPAPEGQSTPTVQPRTGTTPAPTTSTEERARSGPTTTSRAAPAAAPRTTTEARPRVRARGRFQFGTRGRFRVSPDGLYVIGFDPDVACGRGVVTPLAMRIGVDGSFAFAGPVLSGPRKWKVAIRGRLVEPRRAEGTFRLRGPSCDTGVRRFAAARS